MNAATASGVFGAAFLLALGVVLWLEAGPAVFSAVTAFGTLICG